MKAYFEDLWARLPADLEPHDFARRRDFLLAHVEPGQAVLDLGAAQGDFAAALREAGARPVAVEVAEAAVRRARARHAGLDVRLAPLEGPLPLEDASVEVAWAGHVIERVADTARWLSEVRRVLVPGGTLLLTTPAHRALARPPDPLGDVLRLYTARSLRGLLVELGFAGVSVRTRRRTLYARAVR